MEQTAERVSVRLEKSGERREFDLVVGADGVQSATRKMAFGAGQQEEEERVRRLGIYAAFFSVPRDAARDSLWRSWYHATQRRTVMLRPDVRRERSTLFMTVRRDEAKDDDCTRLRDAVGAGAEAQKRMMSEYFVDAGWRCGEMVKAMQTTDDFYYDAIAQVHMDSWSRGRVVLLGDAGYCASPLSGMGTTLALTGAWELAGALTQHPHDIAAAFAQYEKQMRPLVAKAQQLPPGLSVLFGVQTAWGNWLLHWTVYLLSASRVFAVLGMLFKREPKPDDPLPDYGFPQLPELDM